MDVDGTPFLIGLTYDHESKNERLQHVMPAMSYFSLKNNFIFLIFLKKTNSKMTAGSGFRRKEGRDGGIKEERRAGRRDLTTLIVDPRVT